MTKLNRIETIRENIFRRIMKGGLSKSRETQLRTLRARLGNIRFEQVVCTPALAKMCQ